MSAKDTSPDDKPKPPADPDLPKPESGRGILLGALAVSLSPTLASAFGGVLSDNTALALTVVVLMVASPYIIRVLTWLYRKTLGRLLQWFLRRVGIFRGAKAMGRHAGLNCVEAGFTEQAVASAAEIPVRIGHDGMTKRSWKKWTKQFQAGFDESVATARATNHYSAMAKEQVMSHMNQAGAEFQNDRATP